MRLSSRTDAQCKSETTDLIQVSTELEHNGLKSGAALQYVLISDGSVGSDGTRLALIVLYASAAPNVDHYLYWKVERDTLKVFSGGVTGARSRSWSARALSKMAKKKFERNFERIGNPSIPAETGADKKLWIWCYDFCGAAVTIDGPKSRSISELTRLFLDKTYEPLLHIRIYGN